MYFVFQRKAAKPLRFHSSKSTSPSLEILAGYAFVIKFSSPFGLDKFEQNHKKKP
jgi:hypothetical protein